MSTTVKRIVKNKSLPVIKKEQGKYIDILGGNATYLTLEELVLDNIPDDDEHRVKINGIEFKYETSSTPYCCGLIELGSLYLNLNGHKNTELIKYLDLLPASTPGKTLMINTNHSGSCIPLEQALSKCKNWVSVKKFVNKSSRNTVTIWLSNNA